MFPWQWTVLALGWFFCPNEVRCLQLRSLHSLQCTSGMLLVSFSPSVTRGLDPAHHSYLSSKLIFQLLFLCFRFVALPDPLKPGGFCVQQAAAVFSS